MTATLLSWLLIEATLGSFKPKGTANQFMGSTFLIPGARSGLPRRPGTRLGPGADGCRRGARVGPAGGLVRASTRAASAAVLGLVLGAAAGSGAALAAVPARLPCPRTGSREHGPRDGLVAPGHGGPWAAVGAVGGLAFGIGLGGRGRAGRGLLGGLRVPSPARSFYEVVGALALPGTKTMEPIAATWGIRLLAQFLAVISTAAGVAAFVSDSADRPTQEIFHTF